MEEYKMRRGEYLEERVPDLEATVEEYFGPITDTEKYDGSDLHVVEEPDNPVFDRIVAGAVSYSGKKDKLAVEADLLPVDDRRHLGALGDDPLLPTADAPLYLPDDGHDFSALLSALPLTVGRLEGVTE